MKLKKNINPSEGGKGNIERNGKKRMDRKNMTK